jgi:hypothetical protein
MRWIMNRSFLISEAAQRLLVYTFLPLATNIEITLTSWVVPNLMLVSYTRVQAADFVRN